MSQEYKAFRGGMSDPDRRLALMALEAGVNSSKDLPEKSERWKILVDEILQMPTHQGVLVLKLINAFIKHLEQIWPEDVEGLIEFVKTRKKRGDPEAPFRQTDEDTTDLEL